jgi:O-antigen/teichoic acid export membrane protein
MYISISAAILIFLLYYFLIPIYFIYGAAFSLLITTIYAFLTSYFYTKYNCFYIELPLLKYFAIIITLILLFLLFNYLEQFLNLYIFLTFKFFIISAFIYLFYTNFKSEIFNLMQKSSS